MVLTNLSPGDLQLKELTHLQLSKAVGSLFLGGRGRSHEGTGPVNTPSWASGRPGGRGGGGPEDPGGSGGRGDGPKVPD